MPPALWVLLPIVGLAASGFYLSYFFAYRSGDASAVEAGSFSLLLFSPTLGYVFLPKPRPPPSGPARACWCVELRW
ncbi:hypothetical protein [Rhodoferax sp.]|uniref:hypothetical protein n=1 Tax=Rhodoferax sp. TaxID=50421 RepID=UPI0025EAE551|nr:hypothetical protein [Rhodoferax sp.]